MIAKTRNYKLEKKTYIRLALQAVLKKQGWIAASVAVLLCLGYAIPGAQTIWWFIAAFVGLGLYILFWWIQFYGVTQLEQGRMLFEKFSYEINSQQVVMKINAREGMPLKWDQIKSAGEGKDFYVLYINKAQLIYLPFKIFNTDNERKFVGSILKTKGLLK